MSLLVEPQTFEMSTAWQADVTAEHQEDMSQPSVIPLNASLLSFLLLGSPGSGRQMPDKERLPGPQCSQNALGGGREEEMLLN